MEKSTSKIISENLIKLRKAKGLTQIEIAKKFNFSDKTVSKWESGESLPNIDILSKICNFYNVTLNDLANPNFTANKIDESTKQQPKNDRTNKIIITLLSVTLVWILATIIFVYANIYSQIDLWIVFFWAIPLSFLVCVIFNAIWGKRNLEFILISCFVWTLLLAICLQTLKYNLWIIFILGIPSQIAIILWSGLKVKKKK